MTDRKRPDDRGEGGRWVDSYSLSDFREWLAENPQSTTRDVEAGVNTGYKTAYRKLHQLKDQGKVTSRRAGNAHLWSLTEKDEQVLAEERDESDDADDA